MTKKTIKQRWDTFYEVALLKNAPAIQVREMRRAFYCGAFAMLNSMQELGDENMSEDAGVEALNDFDQEIQQFFISMEQGFN